MSLKIPDVPSFVLTYDKGCVMPVRVPQMSTVLGLVLYQDVSAIMGKSD